MTTVAFAHWCGVKTLPRPGHGRAVKRSPDARLRNDLALPVVATFRVNMSPEPVPKCDHSNTPLEAGEDPLRSSQICAATGTPSMTDPLPNREVVYGFWFGNKKPPICGRFF